MTAPTSSRSAHSKPKPCPPWLARSTENTTTSRLPATAQSQKPSRARWCSTQAATAAVTSGSSAVTTAAWLAVTTRSA